MYQPLRNSEFLFAFQQFKYLLNRNLSKRKEFAPMVRSKYLSFSVDPCQTGRQKVLSEFPPLNVYPFLLTLGCPLRYTNSECPCLYIRAV